MIKNSSLFLGLFFCQLVLFSQTPLPAESILQQASSFEKNHLEARAIQKYEEYLKLAPASIQVLCKISELYSTTGRYSLQKKDQINAFHRARDLASQALKIQPNHAEANFVMALAQGNLALVAFGQDKIDAVKLVKSYAEKSVQLDPNSYKGYHVLGKWNYEVSNLSSIEKWLVKMTFGALPEASFKKAAYCFEKSRQLNPGFLLNYLELAKCYSSLNDQAKQNECLLAMEKLPATTKEELMAKKEATLLLNKK